MRNAVRSSYASLLMPHCPVTVVQRYRDGISTARGRSPGGVGQGSAVT